LTRTATGQTSRMPHERPVVKRTARALLLDTDSSRDADGTPRLVLIKRTKPGREPYWITPGGGVEPGVDATVVDALHREVDEELGAKVTDVVPAFVDTVPHTTEEGESGVKVQHFFVCRLASMDLTRRHGPEVEEPCGEYEFVRVPFTREGIASVEVVPPALRSYLDKNIEGVLALLAHDLG
jgi:ADP-ribose pyrophosphatase YjhB (NUDIX family)